MGDMDNRYIRTVLVIGNGFDLNLKLKTRYSDFAKSKEWENLYNHIGLVKNSPLLQFLYHKSHVDQWFDIEKGLYDYAILRKDIDNTQSILNDKNGFNAICEALCTYLRHQVFNLGHTISNTIAGKVLKGMCSMNSFIDNRIYSFNYTLIEHYISMLDISTCIPKIQNIHGDIKNNSIILGIENIDINKISPDYSFLYKSNNNHYSSNELYSDLQLAQTVVIFGHSLNEFDFVYFEDYYKMLINGVINGKLYIVTYDNNSKKEILDNLRKIGISVVLLYQRAKIDFILTSSSDDKNRDNNNKFAELLESI